MTSVQIELPTSHRDRFDNKIREMRAGQAKNVTMFSDREYYEFVTKLKEFKIDPNLISLFYQATIQYF